MLIFDFHAIGNKLLQIRKNAGLTQAEVAEAAGLSDRTYADIERGTVNMRMETLLHICSALHITPNDILTEDDPQQKPNAQELFTQLNSCHPREQTTALRLLSTYLDSLQ